jgi:hypothetical protein
MQKKPIVKEKFKPFCWWCGKEIPAGNLCYAHRDKTEAFIWTNGKTSFTYVPHNNGKWDVKKT